MAKDATVLCSKSTKAFRNAGEVGLYLARNSAFIFMFEYQIASFNRCIIVNVDLVVGE